MGKIAQSDDLPLITYSTDDLRERLSPTDYHNILYILLEFGKYLFINESEVYIQLTQFEDNSGYVELILKSSGRVLEWRYIENTQIYMDVSS